jgi:hypothetical protein
MAVFRGASLTWSALHTTRMSGGRHDDRHREPRTTWKALGALVVGGVRLRVWRQLAGERRWDGRRFSRARWRGPRRRRRGRRRRSRRRRRGNIRGPRRRIRTRRNDRGLRRRIGRPGRRQRRNRRWIGERRAWRVRRRGERRVQRACLRGVAAVCSSTRPAVHGDRRGVQPDSAGLRGELLFPTLRARRRSGLSRGDLPGPDAPARAVLRGSARGLFGGARIQLHLQRLPRRRLLRYEQHRGLVRLDSSAATSRAERTRKAVLQGANHRIGSFARAVEGALRAQTSSPGHVERAPI